MKHQSFFRHLCQGGIAIFLMGILADQANACPTCKEGLANGHDGVSLGYYWSILLMLAMPFVIFATWAIVIWRSFKKMPKESLQAILEG